MTEQIPPRASLLARLGALWLAYLKGQMVMALLIGLVMWTINAGIGLAQPLLMAAVAGLLQSVPTFGPLLAATLATIVALWQGSSVIPVAHWTFALIVAGIYLLVQQGASLWLEPRIMGKRLNLHPLVVLASVLIGATLGNVVGAILAVPLVASVREIVDYVTQPPPRLP